MNPWAILLAAGKGSRLAPASPDCPKQFLPLDGLPMFWHSAMTLSRLASLRGIVFVMPPLSSEETEVKAGGNKTFTNRYNALIKDLEQHLPEKSLGLPWRLIPGGILRQTSVYNGLRALPPDCSAVVIHDAARPFASASLFRRVLQPVLEGRPAAIPGIAVSDTIKSVTVPDNSKPFFPACEEEPEENAGRALVTHTYDRESLRAVQTPQAFMTAPLLKAHAKALREGLVVTDDAALMECEGHPVLVVDGEEGNRKITTAGDLALLQRRKEPDMPPHIQCTGFGYDVHRYGGERPFILGGVPIACDIKVSAHSDGDALLHALMDAMLGCIGGGDIGSLFPDNDPAYDNASSGMLLAEVRERCLAQGLEIHHVDLTIIAQTPRIAPHRENIAANVAKLLHLPPSRVNVKATTEEGLGFTGEKKGIKVVALVSGTKLL